MIEGCKHKRMLKFDIYVERRKGYFLIEYNGKQHYSSTLKLDVKNPNRLKDQQIRDKIKLDFCFKHNIPLYVIKYNENLEEAMKRILIKESMISRE